MTLKYWTNQFPEPESTDKIVISKQQLDFCSANALKIYIGGSQARTGTTTTALGFARLLASRGAAFKINFCCRFIIFNINCTGSLINTNLTDTISFML